jgi:tetratricopeptide (TPR) repeat protein
VIGLLIALAVLLIFALIVRVFGIVVGEEFSPDTFMQRRFVYWEIPLLGQQVSPVYRTNDESAVVAHIRINKLLPASTRKEPRWHFVGAIRGYRLLTGDARVLCTYFSIEQDGQELWLKWTQDNPKLAAILWPAIAEVARGQHYDFVPDIFQLAADAGDPDRFGQDLDRLLAHKYRDVADNQYDLGAFQEAVDLYTRALQRLPGDPAALTGRADAYQAAGELKKAAADRALARRADG